MSNLNKSIRDTVAETLKNDEAARDNDNRLVAIIWYGEINLNNFSPLKQEIIIEIFGMIGDVLTPAESIRRTRQKLQEINSDLRGNKYNKRQGRTEKVVDQLRDGEWKYD